MTHTDKAPGALMATAEIRCFLRSS